MNSIIENLKPITVKWPQCVVTGKKLTVEQAKEVLKRTDIFFTSNWQCGNDVEYENALKEKLGVPTDYEQWSAWAERKGILQLNYLNNSWVSSSFVYGPSGWCHVNGTILFNHNIGKWPSWEEVYEDLETLGAAFPFLDINVHIFNGEECEEERPYLGGLHLCNGQISVAEPIDVNSPECQAEHHLALFKGPSQKLLNEVAEVVKPRKFASYPETCYGEHTFRLEEAIEYFGDMK